MRDQRGSSWHRRDEVSIDGERPTCVSRVERKLSPCLHADTPSVSSVEDRSTRKQGTDVLIRLVLADANQTPPYLHEKKAELYSKHTGATTTVQGRMWPQPPSLPPSCLLVGGRQKVQHVQLFPSKGLGLPPKPLLRARKEHARSHARGRRRT